jgi:hypothetical protein
MGVLTNAQQVNSQQINVSVNGTPVVFQTGQPAMMGGRVMVPMRGVFEQLGASVTWDQAARQVVAAKGGTQVSLHIGDRFAMVNGQQVPMDTPAVIMGGSTMVPLRFISETLGATVDWNAANETVAIVMPQNSGTQIVTTTQTLPTAEPMSLRFKDSANGWVNSGNVHFSLEGPAGGQAVVVMPGLATEIPMTETSPGHYDADWSVPTTSDRGLSIQEGSAMARLTINGKQYYSPAVNNLSVDTLAPTINSVYPAPDSVIAGFKPQLTVNYDDFGSGVDPARVKVLFNGQDVSSSANITPRGAVYTLNRDLDPGQYTADVTVVDKAGNTVTKHWNFSVTGTSVNSDFTFNGTGAVMPGQILHFTLKAAPGSQVTVHVGNRLSVPLSETSPGVFAGDYTVRDRDFFGGDVVTATIMPPNRQQYTIQAPMAMGVSGNLSPSRMAPVIASPLASQNMTNPLVVSGSTLPGATVLISVSYETALGSHTNVHGTLADVQVTADNAGNYQTQPIHIGYSGYGNNTVYRISAVTVLPDGRRSDATVLRIMQQIR